MKTTLQETMFESGKKYKCLKTIDMGGIRYFTEGEYYECKTNNCLVNNNGEENFVQQSFLSHFFA